VARELAFGNWADRHFKLSLIVSSVLLGETPENNAERKLLTPMREFK
jgi:hypothetical protein